MATPVAVFADVGYSGNTLESPGGYEREELLPHRGQINQVARLSEIFLRDLQFHHVGGLLDLVEDGAVWFAGLEVKGSVFGLQDYILAELSV